MNDFQLNLTDKDWFTKNRASNVRKSKHQTFALVIDNPEKRSIQELPLNQEIISVGLSIFI